MYKFYPILDLILLGTMAYYLWLSPYSKVEESFTTQAIHDVAAYGLDVSKYDHLDFPGVVPRTFVGSVILGGVTLAFEKATSALGFFSEAKDQLHLQLAARAALGLANFVGFYKLRSAINAITHRDAKSKVKGLVGFWFTIILIGQFHILYYATRFLPNFVALPLVSHGLAKIIRGDQLGLTWLAYTAVIFRLEIGVFATIIALVSSFIFGQSNIFVNVVMLLAGTVFGLGTLLFVDSYFWSSWMIPELIAFRFNVIDGQASNWGVSPFHEYFTRFLPAWFRPPVTLILAAPGFANDPADDGISMREEIEKSTKENRPVTHPARHSLRILFISSIIYVFAMSFQPHKEWRFIIYIAPVLMLQAANALADILIKAQFLWISRILLILVGGLQLCLIPLSLTQGYVSSYNYPGGEALSAVNDYIVSHNETNALIHLGVAGCMTGASRFGELVDLPGVVYDKTEDERKLLLYWNDVDYLVAESNLRDVHSKDKLVPFVPEHWEEIHVSTVFTGINTSPILNLIFKGKASAVKGLAIQIIHEFIHELHSKSLLDFLRSLVVTKPLVHVWKRIEKDELIPQANVEEKNEGSVAPEVEEVVQSVENAIPDFDEVVEEINEEIDAAEEAKQL